MTTVGTGVLAQHAPGRWPETDTLGVEIIKRFGERDMSLRRDLGQA